MANQPVQAPPSQVQGDQAASIRAQQAIPLPDNSGLPTAQAPPATAGGGDPFAPRPGESVQSGLPIGPGAGGSPLDGITPIDMKIAKLRGIAQASNNSELASLIGTLLQRSGG